MGLIIFCERFVCAESHLAVIGGSNMRCAHYQQSVGTFSSRSSFSTIHFLQGNYGDACCNIFQVKKVFLFYVTYFPLGFITKVILCLCYVQSVVEDIRCATEFLLRFLISFQIRELYQGTLFTISCLVSYQDNNSCRHVELNFVWSFVSRASAAVLRSQGA